jgi:hypothetical protein
MVFGQSADPPPLFRTIPPQALSQQEHFGAAAKMAVFSLMFIMEAKHFPDSLIRRSIQVIVQPADEVIVQAAQVRQLLKHPQFLLRSSHADVAVEKADEIYRCVCNDAQFGNSPQAACVR